MTSALFLASVQAADSEVKDPLAVIGGCLVILLTLGLLIGALISLRALRRPDSNRRCYTGYLCFAGGWLLDFAIVALSVQANRQTFGTLAGLGVFGALGLTGVVMAILGLSDLKREPGKKGKGAAVTTLVLAGVMLLSIGGAFGFGVMKGITQALERRSGGTRAVFEEQRFSIHPGKPWVRLDPAQINPLAIAAYKRDDPEAYLMVMSEEIAPGVRIDLQTVTQNVIGNIEKSAQEHKVVDQADEVLNGLAGRRIICESRIQNHLFTHYYWLHLSENRLYQLVAWGLRQDGAAAVDEGRKAFASFSLLPPK